MVFSFCYRVNISLLSFYVKKVLVTFQPITTFKTSPASVDWGWKQKMLKLVDTVCRQWHNREAKKRTSEISQKMLFSGKRAILLRFDSKLHPLISQDPLQYFFRNFAV